MKTLIPSRLISMAAAAWLVAVSAAPAQDQPAWRTRPRPQAGDYPGFALEFGFSGRATLECDYDTAGVLGRCEVVSEAPEGLGFGAASIRITSRGGAINPPLQNGEAQAGHYTFDIPFGTGSQPPRHVIVEADPDAATLVLAERFVDLMGPLPPKHYDLQSLQELPADRREIVAEWVNEAMPNEQEARVLATSYVARVVPVSALKDLVEKRPLSQEDQKRVDAIWPLDLQEMLDIEAAKAEVRARYCARYDCGGIPQ